MAKKQKDSIPEQTEEAVQTQTSVEPKYKVKIQSVLSAGVVRAYASALLYGEWAVDGITIKMGSKGLYTSMPGRIGKDQKYHDVCFPCTKESWGEFNEAVLSAYQQTLAQRQSDAATPEEDPFPTQSMG